MGMRKTGGLAPAVRLSICNYRVYLHRCRKAKDNAVSRPLEGRTNGQPTIGLILCQEHDRLLAEYRFAGIDKPIGISTYELTRALPKALQSALTTVEEIEAEVGETLRRIG